MDQSSKTPAELVPPDKHPKGLYFLFTTEMWERMSYYGMRSILVYYMMKQLMFSQDKASSIYGYYTGLVYLAPFFGGMLADKWLGQRKAVIVGGVVMAIGEFMLMVQGLFFPGLLMLILGNGLFKPNISTQVGNLYPAGDHRRDRAFSIFYVGINVGAMLSPYVCGTLGERVGYNWGFFAAGVGMLLGLLVYLWGQPHLAPDNIMKQAAARAQSKEEVKQAPLTREEWSKIAALCVLCVLNIVFWMVYEQQGNTLALWVDTDTSRFIFGWEMPASWFQSFNPIMICAFTPLITGLWSWQARQGKEPSSIAKMSIGCILLGLSFLILIPSARAVETGVKASLIPLAVTTAILTVGELYLSPVGLSLVTKLAPARMVSMLMGMWFLSSFFGNMLCGQIGRLWSKMPHEAFFIMLAAFACGAGVVMALLIKPLNKAIGHNLEAA